MTTTMARRGPDDSGKWSNDDGTIHLGFRRLSVMDTSPAGHQPMVSGDGHGVLIFNGEVYNFRHLRRNLAAGGVRFRSSGDTEVVLELLRQQGPRGLAQLNGMFGLAYVDVVAGTVLLARDHFGIKPLHYSLSPDGNGVAFSSRYDALFRAGWLDLDRYDVSSLACLLEFDTTPAPHGLHHHTRQVTPGSWVLVGPGGILDSGRWLPDDEDPRAVTTGSQDVVTGAATESLLADALVDSVGRQRLADVPVGLLLSGGIDSPLVGATLRRLTGEPYPSFTIGSSKWPNDETPHAEAFAAELGLDQHTVDLGPADLADGLAVLPYALHEPLTGKAMVQMLALAKLASKEVTVAMGGDGGDELFFGYNQTRALVTNPWIWKLPPAARRVAIGLGRRGIGPVDNGAGEWESPGAYHRSMLGRGLAPLVSSVLAHCQPHEDVLDLFTPQGASSQRDLAHAARRVETVLHLPVVLNKVDMASMYYGLEVRVPLLDRSVAKAAYATDPAVHVRHRTGKALLRAELERLVDPRLVSSAKRGFGFPADHWLRTTLRDQAEAAMFDEWSGPIDMAQLREPWQQFLRNERATIGTPWLFWTIYTLRLWHNRLHDDLVHARIHS